MVCGGKAVVWFTPPVGGRHSRCFGVVFSFSLRVSDSNASVRLPSETLGAKLVRSWGRTAWSARDCVRRPSDWPNVVEMQRSFDELRSPDRRQLGRDQAHGCEYCGIDSRVDSWEDESEMRAA